ncbi:lipid scramblase CLPTM1L [Amblyomma americanum]
MKFSWTVGLSGVFLAYILHSMWTLYTLYYPKRCDKNELCIRPTWSTESRFQFFFCITTSKRVRRASDLAVLWSEDEFDISEHQEKNVNVTLPRRTLRNGTLDAYVLLLERKKKEPVRSLEQVISISAVSTSSSPLTRYLVPTGEEVQLIGALKSDAQAQPSGMQESNPITHWNPKVEVNIMSDPFPIKANQIPGEIAHLLQLTSRREYVPIVHMTDVTTREKDFIPVNKSIPEMPLKIVISPVSVGRLRLMVTVNEALKSMHAFGLTTKDTDEVKSIFFDTNFYVLLMTLLVSGFHLLFDFLAFKNDVNFWRGRKTFEGLSVKAVLWRGFSQVIIFFYLLDEDTSRIVLATSAVGAIIEVWKVTKAFKISVHWSSWRPWIEFGSISAEETKTQELDSEAMRYLSYLLYPLCAWGAVYSLVYQSYKSWYSWCIHSLANGVYAFGFLFMLPQLFLNYKLKSVAHLPWKVFMYKAFNTFIDDVFAFLITMPTAHRVACFRDDAVFLVYLYQRWLYPVDKSRVNEFGESFEKPAEKPRKE